MNESRRCLIRLGRKSSAKLRLSERTRALMRFVSQNVARRDANPYNAARTRRVSAAGLAPTSGEIVTQIQSGGPRTDSLVRILHAQPASPVSTRQHANAAQNRAGAFAVATGAAASLSVVAAIAGLWLPRTTVWVLIRRLNSSCSRSIAFVVLALRP